jgi:hypothetical protein
MLYRLDLAYVVGVFSIEMKIPDNQARTRSSDNLFFTACIYATG